MDKSEGEFEVVSADFGPRGNSKVPYIGMGSEKNRSGELVFEGHYYAGRRHGFGTEYRNGEVHRRGYWRKGKFAGRFPLDELAVSVFNTCSAVKEFTREQIEDLQKYCKDQFWF